MLTLLCAKHQEAFMLEGEWHSRETLKCIYYVFFCSHISYEIRIIAYGTTTKRNMDIILIQQNRALKIMFHLKQSDTDKHVYETIQFIFCHNKTVISNNTHTFIILDHIDWLNRIDFVF